MFKNIIMAALAAGLTLAECPWFQGCTVREKLGVFLGIFVPLFIFLLFLEEIGEKWRKYREYGKSRPTRQTVKHGKCFADDSPTHKTN